MKLANKIWVLLFLYLFFSCQKGNLTPTPLGSLMLVNTIPGGKNVMLGSSSISVANNSGIYFPLKTDNVNIYIWPSGDSLHPYYNESKPISLEAGDVYSLYLTGSISNVESLFLKDNIPYRVDSTAGIRFINLSPNSPPLNITLTRTSTLNEVTNLNYKQISEFKAYPALASSPLDTFQIRNGLTGGIITTIPFNTTNNTRPRFSNITLVIRGIVGGTPSIGYTRINNDR